MVILLQSILLSPLRLVTRIPFLARNWPKAYVRFPHDPTIIRLKCPQLLPDLNLKPHLPTTLHYLFLVHRPLLHHRPLHHRRRNSNSKLTPLVRLFSLILVLPRQSRLPSFRSPSLKPTNFIINMSTYLSACYKCGRFAKTISVKREDWEGVG